MFSENDPEFYVLAKLSQAELVFANQALMPIGLVFNPILWGIAVHREQADDRIATPRLVIDAPIGEEFHRLADLEFVVCHPP